MAGYPSALYRHYDLPPDFPALALLGDHWKSYDGPIAPLHFHNVLEIGNLKSGRNEFHLGSETVIMEAPCLILIPPHTPHQNRACDGEVCTWEWFYLDPMQLLMPQNTVLEHGIRELLHTFQPETHILPQEENPGIYSVLQHVGTELQGDRSEMQEVVRHLYAVFFLMILRKLHPNEHQPSRPWPHLGRLSPSLDYIDNHYDTSVSIGTLAELCYMSESHFRRLFSQQLGCSPHEYLQTVRIDKACDLLYHSQLPVTEIALQVGFPSASSFSRKFKEIYHITPNQWRTRIIRGYDPPVTAFTTDSPPPVRQFEPQEDGAENAAD